jgi:phosphonate degradation associated HDIG domain protein
MHSSIAVIAALFATKGSDHYGEDMTQLEHALQCAQLAAQEGFDQETIAAALLHDVGHLLDRSTDADMGGWGHIAHETAGAAFLRKAGFGEKIAALVEGHVAAKRYLTATDVAYFQQLSEASKHTLHYQGGPMSAAEVAAFEQNPYFDACIRFRRWDDMAKIPDFSPATFDDYLQLLNSVLDKA